jgi:hypothetical protein
MLAQKTYCAIRANERTIGQPRSKVKCPASYLAAVRMRAFLRIASRTNRPAG